jgi:hypothetical protein
MRRLDNLIFVIIAGLIFLCVTMEYRLAEKRLSLIPIPASPPVSENDDAIEAMIASTVSTVSIDRLPKRNPFRLPDYLIVEEDREADEEDRLEFKLTAICWSRENPLAIIDGRIFRERDEDPLGRFRVERIYPDRVMIERPGKGKKVIKLR